MTHFIWSFSLSDVFLQSKMKFFIKIKKNFVIIVSDTMKLYYEGMKCSRYKIESEQ